MNRAVRTEKSSDAAMIELIKEVVLMLRAVRQDDPESAIADSLPEPRSTVSELT